jgi:hypothetical protein
VDGLLLNLFKVSLNISFDLLIEVCIVELTGEELMHNGLILVVLVLESDHRSFVVVVPDVFVILKSGVEVVVPVVLLIFRVQLVKSTSLIEEGVEGLNTYV